MGSEPFLKWDGEDLVLTIKVSPGAATERISPESGQLHVWIHVTPVDGKANKHLAKLLGKLFRVPQSSITILKGEASRLKTVRVARPKTLPDYITTPS